MSKIDVSVGEDFPVDPPQEHEQHGNDGGCCGRHGAGGDGYEAWRQWREQKRQWRRMRAEWRARRHAMRHQFRREYWDRSAPHHDRLVHSLVLGALAVIGIAAIFGGHHHDHS